MKLDFANLRILNTNTIYIKGIPKELASNEVLRKP